MSPGILVVCVAWFAAAGLLAAEPVSDPEAGLTVNVLSFNIRYGTANDGADSWPRRQQQVYDVIRASKADFCGLQEALRFQLDAIGQAVPGYRELGAGRDDGRARGEYSAILYRQDRWKLERGETLWLSESPKDPGSTSWGNRLPRVVTWGRFVERTTGQSVCVFNTHFDHESATSRSKSAEFLSALIVREAALLGREAGGCPVILTGDFNAGELSPPIVRLKQPTGIGEPRLLDTFRVAHPEAKDVGTFHGFRGGSAGEKIDYIFVDGSAKVKSAEILRQHREGRYPSDHYPVSAELVFPKP